VTVHDLSGNVFVDQLETAIVLPVSNMADSEPPLRIPAPTLIDRDPDHGDGMFVVFEPSTSPDIMSYEIYAVTDSPFLLDNIATLEPSRLYPGTRPPRSWSNFHPIRMGIQ